MNLPLFSVRNKIAVNFLMWFIIIGGIYYWNHLIREFLPYTEPDQASVTIKYPSATPEEVERSVTQKVERAIKNLIDIEEISSRIIEGASITNVTFEKGADIEKRFDELKTTIERVKGELPKETENPSVIMVEASIPAIGIIIYGDVSEGKIRQQARRIREELFDLPGISDAVFTGARDREVWVEVQTEKLEYHELTFSMIGKKISQVNFNSPGGQLGNKLGNMQVLTIGESPQIENIEEIVIQSHPDGGAIRLKDIARVWHTYKDEVNECYFEGKRAILLTVFQNPGQDTILIANSVHKYVKENPNFMGGVVRLKAVGDISRIVSDRLQVLIDNAVAGFFLVILSLLLFMDTKVAFWTASGMMVSFLGTFIMMGLLGVSINMISMLGLIMVLGLVVDDAVVVGENVFSKIRAGISPSQAAVEGTNEVALPIVTTVLTTVAAFLPMLFTEGRLGSLISDLPKVAVCALSISMLESFLILPAHLCHGDDKSTPKKSSSHSKKITLSEVVRENVTKLYRRRVPEQGGKTNLTNRYSKEVKEISSRLKVQKEKSKFAQKLESLSEKRHHFLEKTLPLCLEKILKWALNWRYVTLALALGIVLLTLGLSRGGWIKMVVMPKTDADYLQVKIEMSPGTKSSRTVQVLSRLEKLLREFPEVDIVIPYVGGGVYKTTIQEDTHTMASIRVELFSSDERKSKSLRSSWDLTNDMYRKIGSIPGIKNLRIKPLTDISQKAKLSVVVKSRELVMLELVMAKVRAELDSYEGVTKGYDNLTKGKHQVILRLKENSHILGLTTHDVAQEVRNALYGFEVQKLQRGDEEILVRVLLPSHERKSLVDLERLRITTPSGRVPLGEVVRYEFSRGYGSLFREDGQLMAQIHIVVDENLTSIREVAEELQPYLTDLRKEFAGTSIELGGQYSENSESTKSLLFGFLFALFLIYSIMAVLFHSYVLPLIVMLAIPWAALGAFVGHVVMNYPVNFFSMIGIVGLAGIVVNDSLILVNSINQMAKSGKNTQDVLLLASKSRLRAILLTTITTALGLAPLMFGQGFQSQSLAPVAISIVFGLSLATVFTLIMIPVFYMILRDLSIGWNFLRVKQLKRSLEKKS